MKKLNVFVVTISLDCSDYCVQKIGELTNENGGKFISTTSSFDLFGEKGKTIPVHLRDASPDFWGRRLLGGFLGKDVGDLSEFECLVNSNFDRIGNLHLSEKEDQEAIEELKLMDKKLSKLERRDFGFLLSLDEVLSNNTQTVSLMDIELGLVAGGARPKAVIEFEGKRYIAKLNAQSDNYPVIKLERFGLEMAKLCGINTVETQMLTLPTIDKLGNQKEALLVQRFDRVKHGKVFERKSFMSFLTFLGLSEDEARYASYLDVAKLLSKEDKTELYKRMAFNICIGNTDDHARNFALFWNHLDQSVKLTPVYDVVPFPRAGNEASHSMINGIDENGKESRSNKLANILHSDVLEKFDLSKEEAVHILNHLLKNITRFKKDFDYDFDAKLIEKPILNESIFYGLEEDLLIEFEATMLIEQQKQTEKVIKVNNLKL